MIRNIRGMVLTAPSGSKWVQAGRPHNSRDRVGGLRSRERARDVPDRVVGRGLSRPLADNIADTATWLDAHERGRGGDLTRKQSPARSHQAVAALPSAGELPGERGEKCQASVTAPPPIITVPPPTPSTLTSPPPSPAP